MSLFRNVEFTGHSGQPLKWKIECDALTPDDWAWAAARVAERMQFFDAYGIPSGGKAFVRALRPHKTPSASRYLLVDDVLTTGASMRQMQSDLGLNPDLPGMVGPTVLGVVLFARIPPPEPWIKAIFIMPEWGAA